MITSERENEALHELTYLAKNRGVGKTQGHWLAYEVRGL